MSCRAYKRVTSKLEEGDFRGAVRIACSEDYLAPFNSDTLSALQAKHPAPHPDSTIPAPSQANPVQVDLQDVASTIRSFPSGSAGGPDRLRPQNLKDMLKQLAMRTQYFSTVCRPSDIPFSQKTDGNHGIGTLKRNDIKCTARPFTERST